MPYETPHYLKLHIAALHRANIPAAARVAISEYVTLAKTRLSDLGHSTAVSGTANKFNPTPSPPPSTCAAPLAARAALTLMCSASNTHSLHLRGKKRETRVSKNRVSKEQGGY